jgi:immune inhibitor A
MSRRVLVILSLCLLLLSSCSSSDNGSAQATPGVQQPGNNLPSPTAQDLPSLRQTEQLLLMTPPQVSNLLNVARRLKTQASTGTAPATRTTPLNRHTGQEDTFWIENQDTETYSQIRARLIAVTAHTYMYVQDGQPFNQAALQASADAFEQQIYPEERATAGSEWTPGIDGDAHITILNAAGLGNNVGGYFSAQDEYPTSVNRYSNQREMFYMNLDGEIPGSPGYNSTLANEFQRLISWHEHPLTLDWMNEGMAILAQHLNNYSAGGVDQAFLQAPDIQLNDWSSDPGLEPGHEGASYLFLDYFAEHYGGYGVLKALLQDPAPPPTNFDDVLAKSGYADRFADVVRKWLIANFIADPSIDNSEYGYPTLHFSGVTPQHVVTSYPLSEAGQVSQYAGEYYDLQARPSKRGVLSIQFSGSPSVRLMGNDPFGSTDEWWGNRANNMDSTLTRGFDLRSLKGQHATLQFATWFELEQDRDYAYVEVSTDNGASWTTLKGNDTTSSNPNGLNWGNGYTGVSGGGDSPAWTQESVDLTPYTGKKILIRFEELTDNATALQGFALDQIRIPELHFQDDVTTDNGWMSSGFIRTHNILPEHYQVQALVYTGSTFTVQAMNVDLASAKGTLTIPSFGGQVTRVVLVVSAYALDTTLQAHYQLEIRAS